MEDTPKPRPEGSARDPFRRRRGSFDLFGRGKSSQPETPFTAPAPPPVPEQDDVIPIQEEPYRQPPPPPPPPSDWPPPPPRREPRWDDYDLGSPPPAAGSGVPDLSILFVLLDALRRMVPGDLQGQFNSLLREVLKTLRSMIDWYLERLDSTERKPEVEDIPID